tara:strand:+ start:3550 stop:4374 length:825 start_codon:yes stop_codon:yes gene_type:complete
MTDEINKAFNFSKNLKKTILETAFQAGSKSAHLGGALSSCDIISLLFSKIMNFNIDNFKDNNRDRFILSKGHACLAYYAALSEIGLIKKEELKTFEENGSNLLGHPIKNNKIGIEYSTGSLGMGLSIGIGLSIASQKKNYNFKTFVLMGDGECNEGAVWEAAMSAPNLSVNNLVVIIDRNKFQQTGTNEEIMDLDPLNDKWKSFGWVVKNINGHDLNELNNYFNNIDYKKPNLLIAETIKGKGFSFSENNNSWHHGVLSKKIYEEALKELKQND